MDNSVRNVLASELVSSILVKLLIGVTAGFLGISRSWICPDSWGLGCKGPLLGPGGTAASNWPVPPGIIIVDEPYQNPHEKKGDRPQKSG